MSATLIIGHRGFPTRFPDNSLDGVRAALAMGADGVEVDVRPCLEGRWVCHHDRTWRDRSVAVASLAELAAAGVPSLADVVEAVPGDRWLYVEVKPLPILLLERGHQELLELLGPRCTRIRLLSSSLAILEALGALLPGADRSWVVDRVPSLRPPSRVALSPKHTLVERLLPWGVPLHPWTVNRRGRMAVLLAEKVASLTTNRPDLALAVRDG